MYRRSANIRYETRVGRGSRIPSYTADPGQFEDSECNLRPLCIEDILLDSAPEPGPISTDTNYGNFSTQSGKSLPEENLSDTLEELRRTVLSPLNKNPMDDTTVNDTTETSPIATQEPLNESPEDNASQIDTLEVLRKTVPPPLNQSLMDNIPPKEFFEALCKTKPPPLNKNLMDNIPPNDFIEALCKTKPPPLNKNPVDDTVANKTIEALRTVMRKPSGDNASQNDTVETLHGTIPQQLNQNLMDNTSPSDILDGVCGTINKNPMDNKSPDDSSKFETITELKSENDSSANKISLYGNGEDEVQVEQCAQPGNGLAIHSITKPPVKFPFENLTIDDINTFIQFKNKLRILETTRRESFITCITNFFNDTRTTPHLLNQAVEFILQKCVEKPFWSELLASHANILVRHKIYGPQFKTSVMEGLEKYFQARTVMYENYPKKFSNFVILLGEFFLRYRMKSMVRFRIFSEPLCDILLMLTKSSSEENVKVIAQQISLNGDALKNYCNNGYEAFILEIRLKLLETTNDSERLWMLLCLDLSYCQELPEEVKKMYTNTLGSNIFNELKPPNPKELHTFIPANLAHFYNLNDSNIIIAH